jgi:hypothetical protein
MNDKAGDGFITPSGIILAIAAFVAAFTSLAFNPFFAVSVIAIACALLTLRNATHIHNYVAQGVLRIVAVLAIVGGLGGVVVLAFPTLGLPA